MTHLSKYHQLCAEAIILMIVLTLFTVSCSSENKTDHSVTTENVHPTESSYLERTKRKDAQAKNLSDQFQIDLNEKDKLFLKYWYQMSEEDFRKVSEILYSEGKIFKVEEKIYYRGIECLDNPYIFGDPSLTPLFRNNKLISITLSDCQCIYPSFQRKYGIPKMSNEYVKQEVFVENNPLYDPQVPFYKGKGLLLEKVPENISSIYRDNSSFLNSAEKVKISRIPKGRYRYYSSTSAGRKTLPKKLISINKNAKVLIEIEQIIDYSLVKDLPSSFTFFDDQWGERYVYSIEEQEAYINAQKKSILGIDIKFHETDMLITNSKTRKQIISYPNWIDITFKSKIEIEKDLQNKQKQKQDLDKLEEIQEMQRQENIKRIDQEI